MINVKKTKCMVIKNSDSLTSIDLKNDGRVIAQVEMICLELKVTEPGQSLELVQRRTEIRE